MKVTARIGGANAESADLRALTRSDQIQTHLGLVSQMQSALSGAGAAGDGADGARLQALAVQQALAAQTGPVANQAPQALLSLFRS